MSPAIGVYIGGGLTAIWGMRGVFSALAIFAAALLLGCLWLMPETRPHNLRGGSFLDVLRRMAGDRRIALAAILVAAFNISLFSYYSLAPFLFARFDLDATAFGYSGVALAAGSLFGALLNRRLLRQNVPLGQMLAIACILHRRALPPCTCCGNRCGLWRRSRWSPSRMRWRSRWFWDRR